MSLSFRQPFVVIRAVLLAPLANLLSTLNAHGAVFIAGLAALLVFAGPLSGVAEGSEPGLQVMDGKIYLPIPGSQITAGYGTLKNSSAQAVEVKFEKVEKFRAVELHQTREENGVARMQKIPSLAIAPQSEAVLRPGGAHLMLFTPEKGLKAGDLARVHATVNGKSIILEFKLITRD